MVEGGLSKRCPLGLAKLVCLGQGHRLFSLGAPVSESAKGTGLDQNGTGARGTGSATPDPSCLVEVEPSHLWVGTREGRIVWGMFAAAYTAAA